MWAYIKENKLQDPKNKSMIKCDEKLSKVYLQIINKGSAKKNLLHIFAIPSKCSLEKRYAELIVNDVVVSY